METRVLIRSGSKQWCSRWNLILIGKLVSEIYLCLKGWMEGRRLESHPISSLRAFGSGELKVLEIYKLWNLYSYAQCTTSFLKKKSWNLQNMQCVHFCTGFRFCTICVIVRAKYITFTCVLENLFLKPDVSAFFKLLKECLCLVIEM